MLDAQEARIAAWRLLAADPQAAREAFAAAGDVFGAAESALAAGDPSGALEEFIRAEQVLADRASHLRVPAIARRAACLVRMGEPEYAAYLCQSTLDTLLADGLTDPHAMLWLACASYEAGRLLPFPEVELPRDDAQAELYEQLGASLRAAGHHAEAADAYDRAIELRTLGRLRPALARCLLALADTADLGLALDYAGRAGRLSTDDGHVQCRLADLHRRAGHLAEAEALAGSAAVPGLSARTLALITADRGEDPGPWFARATAEFAGDPAELAETHRLHALHLAARGDSAAAAALLDTACGLLL